MRQDRALANTIILIIAVSLIAYATYLQGIEDGKQEAVIQIQKILNGTIDCEVEVYKDMRKHETHTLKGTVMIDYKKNNH